MGLVKALRRIPIRARLTLAFALAMAVVLTATGAFVYFRMKSDLNATVDSGLRNRGADAVALAGKGFGGHSALTEKGENLAQVLSARGRVVDGTPGYRSRPLISSADLRGARRGATFVERRH